ncbi:hypothetical protein [Homoserinibacter gongjuensis]|uniref:Primosomal protein N' 3' DNA-binding domain-containing protein n=1 Tax=Homoserinibacter gongjuensis TaxID=1162968 RepID=A0ABQ6JW34_9MICO|nr:hypothetical protein [Homoserinibacter gongjuensis]GMA92520.1 hypothetical protein GCM10025869_30490 [Homoserinibacter gongjuensis]
MSTPTIARVVLDTPLPQLDRLLDYRIPEGMEGVVPGVRVMAPLRSANRMTQGFVVELTDEQEHPGPLSDLDSVVSAAEVLRPEVWRLARAVADRAAGSAIDVLRLAIPKRQVRVEKSWLTARASGTAALAPLAGEPVAVAGYRESDVTALLSGGRVALSVDPGVVAAGESWVGRWAMTLAQLAARTVIAGASAILVVPDHRDAHQLEAALGTLLPAERLVRFDSAQPDADRYRGMLRAMGDDPVVVLGNRSAVYAPAAKLGLLAVWNDGDPLLSEPLTPYVHARDAALVRQEQQGGALVFAGHTRTTDVQRLVEVGWLTELAPSARVASRSCRPHAPRVLPPTTTPGSRASRGARRRPRRRRDRCSCRSRAPVTRPGSAAPSAAPRPVVAPARDRCSCSAHPRHRRASGAVARSAPSAARNAARRASRAWAPAPRARQRSWGAPSRASASSSRMASAACSRSTNDPRSWWRPAGPSRSRRAAIARCCCSTASG